MALFRYLNDDAFLVFSREHKHLYAACLLDLHERFFTGAPAFPTPQQVVHAIYDVMSANPSLWTENDDFGGPLPEIVSAGRRRMRRADLKKISETGDKALLIARQLYSRLLASGWLEEEEYGLRVTVDMAMGPLLVIQRLASLNKDVSQRFGGLVVQIRLNLEAVERRTRISRFSAPKSATSSRKYSTGTKSRRPSTSAISERAKMQPGPRLTSA